MARCLPVSTSNSDNASEVPRAKLGPQINVEYPYTTVTRRPEEAV